MKVLICPWWPDEEILWLKVLQTATSLWYLQFHGEEWWLSEVLKNRRLSISRDFG
jgi:hypothetical protein